MTMPYNPIITGHERQRRWLDQTIRARVRTLPSTPADCADADPDDDPEGDSFCGPDLYAEYIVPPADGGSTTNPANVVLVCTPHSNVREAQRNAARFTRDLPNRRMRHGTTD